MNRKQSRGMGRQIGGAIKDATGRITRDRSLQGEGKIDKGLGKVQKKVGDAQAPGDLSRGVPPSKDDL